MRLATSVGLHSQPVIYSFHDVRDAGKAAPGDDHLGRCWLRLKPLRRLAPSRTLKPSGVKPRHSPGRNLELAWVRDRRMDCDRGNFWLLARHPFIRTSHRTTPSPTSLRPPYAPPPTITTSPDQSRFATLLIATFGSVVDGQPVLNKRRIASASASHTGWVRSRGISRADTQNREWSSTPVSAFAEVPSASRNPPTTSSCHNSIGRPRSHRFQWSLRRCRRTGSITPARTRHR